MTVPQNDRERDVWNAARKDQAGMFIAFIVLCLILAFFA